MGQSADVVDIRYSMRSRRHRLVQRKLKSSATVFRVAEHVFDPTWSVNVYTSDTKSAMMELCLIPRLQ